MWATSKLGQDVLDIDYRVVVCPLESLDEECRQGDVDKTLMFGNHKGASLQPKLLKQLVLKDVHFGYCLPLPLAKARKIPGILLAPMNIQKQNSINKLG